MRRKGIAPAKTRVKMSAGESVRVLHELQELTQAGLAKATGIPQSTISGIENGRIKLGVERAKTIARALKCHPALSSSPAGTWRVKAPPETNCHRSGHPEPKVKDLFPERDSSLHSE